MFGDSERPARVRAEQDRALAIYVRRQVFPYSAFHRERIKGSGLDVRRLRRVSELGAVPAVPLTDLRGADLVLRPDRASMLRYGPPGLVARVAWASVTGRHRQLNRAVLDPIYKPVHWIVEEAVPIGSTVNDTDRLGEIGRRWLEAAGVRAMDGIVSVVPPGPHLAFWQLALGARRAGVPALMLGPDAAARDVVAFRPTVVAGRPEDLVGLAKAGLQAVHTVLVMDAPPDEGQRAMLTEVLGRDVAILWAWAPPGTRALWTECRGANGLHTWPAAEVVEVVHPATGAPVLDGDEGEVVWSALGWAGSVVLRLATGVQARLDTDTCPVCRRSSPRLRVRSSLPVSFSMLLDTHPGVGLWQAELTRRNGHDELVVFVAPARAEQGATLVRDLDTELHATQYVVLSPDEVLSRITAHGHQKVLDRRS